MVARGSSPLVVLLTIGVIVSARCRSRKVMGMALIPRDDQSEYEVAITTPEGYSLERTDQALRRARGPAPEAPGDRAHLHDDRPDQRRPGRQGRGGRHPRDDLRPDERPGGRATTPSSPSSRRPATCSCRLPRPPRQRQRRLGVPGGPPAADVPGQPRRPRPRPSSPSTPTR